MIKETHVKLLVLIILAFTSVAQAQNKKLVFSNGQETEIQGNATINISTGDITVQPIGDKLIVDEVPAIVGFYPDTYGLESFPAGITVNWAVAYASSCNANVTAGNASGWSGSINNGEGSLAVTIQTASTTLELDCTSADGSIIQPKSFTIVQTSSGGGTTTDPVIDSFYLTNYPGTNPTIPADGTYNIQWSVSNLTGSCTADNTALNHGGWDGAVSSSGNMNIAIEGEPILRLICQNGGNSVQASITINNSGGGGTNPPANCSQVDVWTPPGLVSENWQYDDPYAGGNQVANPGTNGFGAPFLDVDNSTKQIINIINPEQRYIVISNVQVPNTNFDRKFTFNGSPGYGVNGPTTFSFSECPGNFNPSTARCVGEIYSRSILMSTDPSTINIYDGQPNFCALEKGKTYYLNMVFAQPYDGTIFNGTVLGEECSETYTGNTCAIFWGEKAF